MTSQQAVVHDQLQAISQNSSDFNRTSRFQSSVICFLAGFRRNKEDMAKLRKQFQAIDVNSDGFITLDEMQNATNFCQ